MDLMANIQIHRCFFFFGFQGVYFVHFMDLLSFFMSKSSFPV